MRASSLILWWCALLIVLSGCSTPCEDVCSSFNDCTVQQRDHKVDCATYCGREQQFEESAENAGMDDCSAQFDAHMACWEANIGAICDAASAVCQASADAWLECVAKFCAAEENANDQACVPQDEGPALPALTGF